jgi:hypothetical protein
VNKASRRRRYDGDVVTKPKSIIDSALKLLREERARVAREIIDSAAAEELASAAE